MALGKTGATRSLVKHVAHETVPDLFWETIMDEGLEIGGGPIIPPDPGEPPTPEVPITTAIVTALPATEPPTPPIQPGADWVNVNMWFGKGTVQFACAIPPIATTKPAKK